MGPIGLKFKKTLKKGLFNNLEHWNDITYKQIKKDIENLDLSNFD